MASVATDVGAHAMLDERIALLGVPTSAGAYGLGLEQAPDYLREHGLAEALRAVGFDVEDAGDLPTTVFAPDPLAPTAQSLPAVVAVAKKVATALEETLQEGSFVVVMGGDCTITLGVMAAFVRTFDEPGLLYLDGDIDLATPEHTRSGILDAMVLAHLLGETRNALAEIGPRYPLLSGRKLAAFGYDEVDIDDRERSILEHHCVAHLSAQAAGSDVAAAANRMASTLASRCDALCVHFDVDAVDSIELPLAKYPHFNQGMTLQNTRRACAHSANSPTAEPWSLPR